MKNFHPKLGLLLASLFTIASFSSYSQVPGFINRQATNAAGRFVLDPNGDGYTSITTSGFGANDVTNSEIIYHGIRAYSIEPNSDLRRGPNHAYSDFVPDSAGNGVYYYFDANQKVIFRMRMGGIMPGSKGYSILMDTDGKFGATGPNADPNYLPSTTGTNGNPGFEIEIVLETNFRIAIYNVDGTSSPVLVKQYTNWQDMSQISLASTNDNGDPDFLIDFYIPFSDLQAAPFNLTASSTIRMSATTVMSPQAAIGGPRSDIYGTAGDSYEDFINGQPACAIFNTLPSCPTAMCTAPPTLNSPLGTGTVTVSGAWTKSVLTGALSTATITVYKNGVSVGTVPSVTNGNTWSLNNVTLSNGDIITAKAQAVGESMCLTSNAVIASTCNSTNIPLPPVLSCTSGSKGITGTNLSTGWTVHVDNITRNVNDDNVANTSGLFGANSGSSPNITWLFSGGCSAGAPLTSGSYKVYYTDNVTGCISQPSYFCAAGNGGNALAGSLAAPAITSPAGSVFTTAVNNISGTTDANATLALFVNGINIQNITANGTGAYSFTNLKLLVGQQLYITTELNTGTVATSKCASQTSVFTVTCFTQPPLIDADNNNQLTAAVPINGTSSDVAGTIIRVYTAANVLVASTTVQANGTWSTGNAGTTPAIYNAVAGTSYYANAQNGGCGLSANSASFTAATGTSSVRCGTITGPVTAGAASISGNLTGSFSTTTVNLYLDGQLIGSTTSTNTLWGPITVNSLSTNTLYPNGVLSIGIQESGKQEVACPASAITITCSPTPVVPLFSPSSITINQYQTVTFTVSNAVSGTFYAATDSATGTSFGQGKWATSNGNLTLVSSPFNTAGTFKVVIRSTSLTGVTSCTSSSLTGTVIVSPVTLPLNLLEFKGKKQTNSILLDWITANESGLHKFEIERSADGLIYEKTGEVRAAPAGGGQKSYTFTDTHPLSTTSFYRLRILDIDGRFTYSNTLMFTSGLAPVVSIRRIQPNPFTTDISMQVDLDKAQPVSIRLLDAEGRLVYTKETKGQAGANTVFCNNLPVLSPGLYVLQVVTASGTCREKVMRSN